MPSTMYVSTFAYIIVYVHTVLHLLIYFHIPCTVGTFPIDTTKTRLQVQGQRKDIFCSSSRYRGMTHALLRISQEEGVKALYKGWVFYFCLFVCLFVCLLLQGLEFDTSDFTVVILLSLWLYKYNRQCVLSMILCETVILATAVHFSNKELYWCLQECS